MTEDELLDLFKAVAILDSHTAHRCAEAALLEFLCTESYDTIVEAYLTAVATESVAIPTGKAP